MECHCVVQLCLKLECYVLNSRNVTDSFQITLTDVLKRVIFASYT
jgi:hypothetical protein